MMVVDVLDSTTIPFAKPRVFFEGTFAFSDTEAQTVAIRDGDSRD